MATKVSWAVTYDEGLSLIKMHDSSITWSWTSPGMLTPLYLDYQNAFGHKT